MEILSPNLGDTAHYLIVRAHRTLFCGKQKFFDIFNITSQLNSNVKGMLFQLMEIKMLQLILLNRISLNEQSWYAYISFTLKMTGGIFQKLLLVDLGRKNRIGRDCDSEKKFEEGGLYSPLPHPISKDAQSLQLMI